MHAAREERETMIVFIINGVVREMESRIPLPGLLIKAFDKDLVFDDVLGSAFTNQRGEFEILTELEEFREFFDSRPDIYFKAYRGDGRRLVHTTEDAVHWGAGRISSFEILIPGKRLDDPAELELALTDESGQLREELEVGESMMISASGLRPAHAYDIRLSSDGDDLFTTRLVTNMRGDIEPSVLWPQMGLDDPAGDVRFTPEEARDRWTGRTLNVALFAGESPLAERELPIAKTFEHPLLISTDSTGRLLNGFEVGSQPLFVTIRNAPFRGRARIYLVRAQQEWREGDYFEVASLSRGELAMLDMNMVDGDQGRVIEFAEAAAIRPGAYDLILRPVHYGFEEDEAHRVLASDVIANRRSTSVVVREAFWTAKPVLGGCVNRIPVSGRSISGAPYFQYTDTFEVGENVYAALDPGIMDPGNLSKMCAFYVVQSKTDAQWNSDTSLSHLAVLGGNPAVTKVKVQSGCINANKVLLWPNASVIGEYDIVADFGNNTPDAMSFVQDNAYDTPLDVIDGYFLAGFRVVEDPGNLSDPGLFAGTWIYDETTVAAMGLPGTISVDDESGSYATPGGFSVLTRQVRLKAHVSFPADAPGVTDPAQISATKPNFPLVVIVHGNGHDYGAYDFLLQHLARNGFVAASIDNRYLSGTTLVHGMHGLGRANNFFQHLTVLRTKFGPKLQNDLGVMGHSRGGEAVVKIARLNSTMALGNNINALLSLAPTDQYGKEVLAGAYATPLFVLYGSRDGDVAGWSPSFPFDWRKTGFSLFDRAADAPKSMAFVYRATHNGFITINSDNPGDMPLSEMTQRAITQAYATAFFRQHLLGESKWSGMFTGEWKPASISATGAEVYFQYRASAGKTIDDFEGAANWQSSTVGGSVSHGGTLPVDPAEARLFDFPPGSPGLDPKSPHDTNGLRVRWDGLGDRLAWTIPPAHADVSGYSVLSLRVTQKEGSASNPANLPQDLRVRLRDSASNERAIRASAFGPIPFPDQRSNSDLRKSAMATIRIPLTAYTIVCAGQPQVDLHNVVELSLDFTMTSTGEIEVDEIEFAT